MSLFPRIPLKAAALGAWIVLHGLFVLSTLEHVRLPPIAALLVVATVMLYLPGAALGGLLARRDATPDVRLFQILDAIWLSLVFWVFGFALAYILGQSFYLTRKVLYGVSVLLWIPAVAWRGLIPFKLPQGERRGPSWASVLLLAVVALFAMRQQTALQWHSDGPDHLAFVQAILSHDEILPLEVFHLGGDGPKPDPRKGFLHAVYAAMLDSSAMGPTHFWKLLPGILAPGILLALMRFARAVLGWQRAFWLPGLLGLLVFRGGGLDWLAKSIYPSWVVHGMVWLALARWLEERRHPQRQFAVGFSVLGAGSLIHVMLAPLFAVGAACLLVADAAAHRFRDLGRPLLGLLALGVGGIVPLAWRLWISQGPGNFIHTHAQGIIQLRGAWVTVAPYQWFVELGLVGLLALWILPFLRPETVPRARVVALALGPPLLLLVPPVGPLLVGALGYVAVRLLSLVPTALILCLAFSEIVGRASWRSIRMSGLLLATTLALGVGILPHVLELPRLLAKIPRHPEREWQEWGGLWSALHRLPRGSVILSDPMTSYLVPMLTEHYVVGALHQHGTPQDSLDVERSRLLRDFYLDPSRAVNRMADAQVDYVLINHWAAAMPPAYWAEYVPWARPGPELSGRGMPFTPVVREDGFSLWAFDAGGSETSKRSTASARPVLPAKGWTFAEEGLHLDLRLPESVSVAGAEELELELVWRTTRPLTDPRPVWVTLRLESENLPAPWIAPVSKIQRRIRERFSGVRHRQRSDVYLVASRSGDPTAPPLPPDLWETGVAYQQSLRLPIWILLEPGPHVLRALPRRRSFFPNYELRDWLNDNDSLQGPIVGRVQVEPRVRPVASTAGLGKTHDASHPETTHAQARRTDHRGQR